MRFGYRYIIVQIGREVICILVFGLALFFPIYAAHLQDDKCGLAFTRFMELRPGGKKVRKVRKDGDANMTLEEAEDAAARDGLVLVPSRKNQTGYKGVTEIKGRYKADRMEGGTMTFIGSYASKHKAALEYARWIGPQNAKREAAAVEAQAASANMTLEEAEAIAARDGLVLVPSKTGYKGVTLTKEGRFQARSKDKTIGSYATLYEAALEYARHIGPQQAAAEKAAEEAAEKAAKAAAATFEEAKATAESEGLVIVTSKANATGYRGVSKSYTMTLAGPRLSGYHAKGKRGTDKAINIGTYTTSHEAALHYARHIGPQAQQAAAEKAAEERGKKR